jgi:hypothetical protein
MRPTSPRTTRPATSIRSLSTSRTGDVATSGGIAARPWTSPHSPAFVKEDHGKKPARRVAMGLVTDPTDAARNR